MGGRLCVNCRFYYGHGIGNYLGLIVEFRATYSLQQDLKCKDCAAWSLKVLLSKLGNTSRNKTLRCLFKFFAPRMRIPLNPKP